MDKDKQSFILYRSWASYILALPDQQAAQLIKAICAFETGSEYEIKDDILHIYYMSVVLPELKRNEEKYEQICTARAEAGRKGGRPRADKVKQEKAFGFFDNQSKASATKSKQKNPESESESVSDSVSESVSASEKEKKGAAHSAYDPDPEVNSAIKDFVDQRKKLRKPMTDRAIQLFRNRLESLSKGDKALKIQMIDTAIERGWQTVYPPKEEKRGSTYIEAIRNRYDGIDEWAQGGEVNDKSGV